jgi:UDP-4-amino-4,6-dideoxy-N-acetyl-beta-L-altrosamine N-acetyltransferase
LRAAEREDLKTFVRWFNDPQVRQYLTMFRPLSMAQEERWFETLLQQENELFFVMEVEKEGNWYPLGTVGLHPIDWKNRTAVFGISLGDAEDWGKGYGTDAVRTMLKYCFDELNLNRVELNVFEYNDRAIQCYEKAGFRQEGVKRQAMFRQGKYVDVIFMAVLKSEFFMKRFDPPAARP